VYQGAHTYHLAQRGTGQLTGTLTSNSSGSVFGVLDYPSDAVPRVYSNPYVEVYGVKSSGQFGWGLGSAKVTIEVCLPTGLGFVVPRRTAVRLPPSPP
jgi:hypothetical protein